MELKEKVVFVSKGANLNIIKQKGATVVTAIPGGTKSEVTPTSWIKFRNYKYVAGDPEEIEIIRRHIKEYPGDRIRELVPQTPRDILREKEARAAEAMRELEKARKVVGEPELRTAEATSEPQEEKTVYTEKCPDCPWVAESSTSQVQAKSKLRGHRAAKHKTVK